MIRLQPLIITVTLLTFSSIINADYIYKCQGIDGRKVFSGLPCGPNAVREEYRNIGPSRKAAEDLPPRQGELLNKPVPNKADIPVASGIITTKETKKQQN